MEARKITVVQTKGAGKTVIMSGAETLGQLKGDFRENGIAFDDMVFYEGVSRTELIDEASILPSNLPYKGQVTNELVIMLTLKNKKIRSGMTRSEAYAAVKDNKLGDAIKLKFGKNFTTVSTDDLEKFINGQKGAAAPKAVVATPVVTPVEDKKKARPDAPVAPAVVKPAVEAKAACECSCKDCNCKAAIVAIVDVLDIDEEEKEEILALLNTNGTAVKPVASAPAKPKKPVLASSFDDDEIANMMKITN